MKLIGYQPSIELALVVSEDSELIDDIQQTFCICMAQTAVKVIGTGADIIQVVKSLKPQLVILDLDGGDGNHFSVLQALKGASNTPVITTSYSRDESTLVKSLEYGSDGHVNKPIRQLELIAHVRAVMRRNNQRCYSDSG